MQNLIQCWHCGGTIETQDKFCRHCGKGQSKYVPFRYTHAGIVLFSLIIGPLVLPFVWKSPVISQTAKIVYTVLNFLLLVLLVLAIIGIYTAINTQMQEQLKMFDQINSGQFR